MSTLVRYLPGALRLGFPALLLLLSSCRDTPPRVTSTSNIRMTDEKLINYNRGVIKSEDQEIEDFLSRYSWKMQTTPTGLRYLIYQKGNGVKSRKGFLARMNYELRLLNSQLIYTSDSLGPKEFIIGYGGVESGLEEAVLLLRQGDRAKIIIPSYLAYGLLGDQQKVPPGATLVYDLELLELKPNK